VSIFSLVSPVASPFATEGWAHLRARGIHAGLDFRAPVGTPAFAAHSGTVVYVGPYTDTTGLAVEIVHSDFATRYLHLSKTAVAKGQAVSAGQLLGHTGFASSPHLHWDIWGLPHVVAQYNTRFGAPIGNGGVKIFSGKSYRKMPGEPLVPGIVYQADVLAKMASANIKPYSAISSGVGGIAAGDPSTYLKVAAIIAVSAGVYWALDV